MVAIIATGVLLTGLVAYGGWVFYQQNLNQGLQKITYGYQDWPGVLPYLVAYDQGFFKQVGLDVLLVKEDSYVQGVADLISGRVDFVGDIALIDLVKRVSAGSALKVVLATDYSNGADGIVAKSDIKSIKEFKGKRIALEKETIGEYLLYDALRKNNLTLNDVTIIDLAAQEAAQAFIRKEVDVTVTYEPGLSSAVSLGQGNLIYTSADSPGLIIDVLAFRAGYLASNEGKAKAVVAAYFKAIDYIDANPSGAYAIGAKYFEVTPAEFQEQLKGIKQMKMLDNLNALAYKSSLDSLHGQIKAMEAFLQTKGNIINPVDSLDIIEAKYVRELNQQ